MNDTENKLTPVGFLIKALKDKATEQDYKGNSDYKEIADSLKAEKFYALGANCIKNLHSKDVSEAIEQGYNYFVEGARLGHAGSFLMLGVITEQLEDMGVEKIKPGIDYNYCLSLYREAEEKGAKDVQEHIERVLEKIKALEIKRNNLDIKNDQN